MIHRSREKIGPLFERLDNSWEHSALFPSTERMKHAILDKNENAGRLIFLALLFECRFAMSDSKVGALTRFQGISHPHSTFFGTWKTLVTRTQICSTNVKTGMNTSALLRTDFVNGILMLPRIEICHLDPCCNCRYHMWGVYRVPKSL